MTAYFHSIFGVAVPEPLLVIGIGYLLVPVALGVMFVRHKVASLLVLLSVAVIIPLLAQEPGLVINECTNQFANANQSFQPWTPRPCILELEWTALGLSALISGLVFAVSVVAINWARSRKSAETAGKQQ